MELNEAFVHLSLEPDIERSGVDRAVAYNSQGGAVKGILLHGDGFLLELDLLDRIR